MRTVIGEYIICSLYITHLTLSDKIGIHGRHALTIITTIT